MSQITEHISSSKQKKSLTALIVDDMSINRNMARIILERNNFKIHEAKNGKEALDSFHKLKPDVVLMDICMPIMNGIEAMKQIRELNKKENSIPIIAYTSGEHVETKTELMDQGFSEYLLKPFKEKDLFEKISLFLPLNFSKV